MSGEGMVAVVRGLQEQGLAVTLLQGNRQYTLLPNSVAPSAPTQRPQIAIANAATQQSAEKRDVDMCTESAQHPHVDRDVQAVDGRYTSTYKTMHCNVRPTSPPVQLTEFPPQRPDLCPGHGNFIVGGAGSGATGSQIKPSSTAPTFRGGLSWPDRGSVCSPRPSHEVDPFVNSLRKYPCLSPDRSSEVMERLINYTTAKGLTRFPRNMSSPTRLSESPPHNPLESKSTNPRATRSYEPDVSIRAKKNDDPPTRDRKRDEFYDTRPVRAYDVRCVREMSKKIRDNVKVYTSYPYTQPVCPATIVDNGDCHAFTCGYQNSSNSVNTEVQAAVTMFSKEVATAPRKHFTRKSVAVPASPISAGEDNVEGETKYVENLNKRTSFKSIQTNPYPSDTTLKPRKSAQTVLSTIDFHSTRNRTVVSRKTKSQEQIKLTKEELKTSLLELINEMSDSVSKNTIRDELIKKLFATADNQEKDQSREFKHDKSNNYVPNLYPPVCDYVGDYQELVGKLKHCYGDPKHIAHSEITPFRIAEYKNLDFVLKDWIHNLHLKNSDRYMDRNAILNYVEDEIKELLKNWTAQDFDLKSEIVNILGEIPIEINKSYNATSYLNKLVDVLLKRMRNVILSPQAGRFRKKPFVTTSRKILTKKDIKDFIRAHLMDFFNEYDPMMCDELFGDLENEMVELTLDSIDCIRCGHINNFMNEMESILQDIGQMTDSEANYLSHLILQDLQEMLNNCHFNQTYMILNVTNGSGQYTNATNNSDFSIGFIQEEDLDANLDRYTSQLCVQINQWLDTLNIPRIKDSGFREVVVNDLAGDIVDRHKFVDLNHTDRDSAQDQLEALKYQIFKWINKLVGDENQETIEHADKLLQMINSVPVPMLVNPIHRKGRTAPCCKTETCSNNPQNSSKSYPRSERENQNQSGFLPPSGNLSYGQGRQSQGMGCGRPPCCKMNVCPNSGNISKLKQVSPRRMEGNVSESSSGPASPNNPWSSKTYSSVFEPPFVNNLSQIGTMEQNQQSVYCPNRSVNDGTTHSHSGCCAPAAPSVKKLNEHYDEYLKQWVKELPIVANTPAEQKAAETARLKIYNEIWKCVTKMKLDPNIMSNNQYYSQNYFEEEIERLLQALPKSKKLDGAKPALKEQLLQKTFKMINLIKSTNAPASFKQQVIDNIDNNLPERTPTGDEEDQQYEELEKQDLADSYILYTRYKDEDHVKATVHKKKFLKKLDDFLEITKAKHNLVDVNKTSYANEIINSIDKIPIPNDQAIKEEADDILLASEVENWITDIPQNPNTTGPLEKRAMRDTIVKKIHEVAECVCVYDNAFKAPLKAELTKYIEKMPGIQEGTNVEYMIDELANRIKNLSTSSRYVSFQSPGNYEEFSEFRPAASSFQELSEGSSYLVVGGNIVKDSGPRRPAWANVPPPVPEEEIQWLSLAETPIPSQMRSGAEVPGQSPQAHLPADQIQQRANSYRGEGNVRYGGAGQFQSMRSQRYGSQQASRNYQGEENDPRNTGPSVPEEDIQWLSLQETQMPSIVRDSTERSRSMQSPQLQRYIPNESDRRTSRSYYEDAQEVPGQFPGVPQTHLSPCCREAFYPNAQDQYTSFGQGQVASNAQEASNLQGGELCNPPCCPNPVCLNKSQAFRDSAPSRPAANSPGLRPNVAFQSQNLGHGAPDPYDARQPYSEQHCTTCPNIGQGPALNTCGQSYGAHARYGRGSLGQMPSQVGQEPWSNIPGYGQTGRSSVYGVIEGSGQGCMATEPNPNGTLNRPFQSPGLVSTGCQVPDQVSRPCNSQNMACGGMDILCTSQIPRPSSRTPSVRVPNQSNTDPGALQGERREAIQSGFCTPADRGIPMIDPNIRKQRPLAAGTNQKPQVYCVPPDYKPLGFSAPCRPFNQREGKHAEGNPVMGNYDMDEDGETCPCDWGMGQPDSNQNDGNEIEVPCRPMGRNPYHY